MYIYVIHYYLSWNPSTLEQRTGRVDRIGEKVERCGLPIKLYFPSIAEIQDEKNVSCVNGSRTLVKCGDGREIYSRFEIDGKIRPMYPIS